MTAAAGGRALGAPVMASAALHALLVAGLFLLRAPEAPPMPPTYRVSLVAAPPGPRAIGVVQPPAATPEPPVTKAPPRPVIDKPAEPAAPSKSAPAPARQPKKSTPTAAAEKPKEATPAPRAGGGPEGGRGADVANVNLTGTEFPFPGYLQNIVRQITVRFQPPRGSQLRADVAFLIQRDGSVTNIRLVQRSGNYSFDAEARGAIEAAARERAFGPLPAGFRDDALPVIFSFDPQLIR